MPVSVDHFCQRFFTISEMAAIPFWKSYYSRKGNWSPGERINTSYPVITQGGEAIAPFLNGVNKTMK